MRILMINSVCGIRSTGRICTDLADALTQKGHKVKIAYGRENVPEQYKKYAVRIGSDLDVKIHGVQSRVLDNTGFGSKNSTRKFLEWAEKYDPDVLHLHNIHGYYINIESLFKWIKSRPKMKVIWTLHDCWAFTGHAAYCEAANCEKWIKGCYECPNKMEYPKAFIDNSKKNWEKKKRLFSNVKNLTLVTPSKWLADLVGKSFLASYHTEVIHNGIDLDKFKRSSNDSIRERFGLKNKKVILGVAAVWDRRKGLSDFIRLNAMIDKKEYKIVLVGLSEEQVKELPHDIVGIRHTESVQELIDLYSIAEVFVNPTYEDNYPTTNIEAIACGTPVITYDTGGSGESAVLFGSVIKKGDVAGIYSEIKNNHFSKSDKDGILGASEAVSQYLKVYSEC